MKIQGQVKYSVSGTEQVSEIDAHLMLVQDN